MSQGEVFDVAVDIRDGSPTFGQWDGVTLSAENGRQLYIPEGFAHGFLVTGDVPALFSYKCTAALRSGGQCSILWDDPDLAIDWPRSLAASRPRTPPLPAWPIWPTTASSCSTGPPESRGDHRRTARSPILVLHR